MSLRTTMSSSSTLLPVWLLTFVVTHLSIHSGCSAAGVAQHPRHSTLPNITSARQLKAFVSDFGHLVHNAEQRLGPLHKSASSLQKKFDVYSNRTARRGWPSEQMQHIAEGDLRFEAHRLRDRIRAYGHQMEQFKPAVQYLRDPSLRSLVARDAPTKQQMEQNVKFYEMIMNLIRNFIECPVHILELLGGPDSGENADSNEPDEPAAEAHVYPEYY
ncbi:uncharacterized protein LOC134220564 [Armigeres subalbatus]|uniref:uncharacterized protein LOC134220564 n=1 Tax=Armigeres subalbatus TaxID=124917 RepID=UPI002ED2CFC0